MSVLLKDYDYPLPRELIAQYPAEKRDHSRLLILDRKSGGIDHKLFHEVIDHLEEGDALVINQTKVFPARVFGTNQRNDRKVEVFFLKEVGDRLWEVLVKPARKVPKGSPIAFDRSGLTCEILEHTESGSRLAKVNFNGDLFEVLDRIGIVPLPPYIKREPAACDKNTYQTVYARETGAVAAPTAGLHFTPELLGRIERKGVELIPITLHVGWDSFRPVRVEHPEEHALASEWFKIDSASAEKINRIKEKGKRIAAVGTTTVRALETAAEHSQDGEIRPQSGWTKKFIYPPFKFQVVDSLITNFHLPRSTLLLLVSALASRELILKAYQEAIEKGYRFYSYGDAMLII
jgi:S-adenosylmethionine:tRNA ribosyltransferase-isomerase